jgi:hypothetical protein
MGYEHFVVAAARAVDVVGVAVLLLGALLAAVAFARRLVRRAAFQDAYHASCLSARLILARGGLYTRHRMRVCYRLP